MPRTLSHVIDVHHRARRKLNIARRHINIYTPGRAVLMQLSFFLLPSLVIAVVARFVFALPSSNAISSPPSPRPLLLSPLRPFFSRAARNTAPREPLRRHAVATGILELAEQTSADKSTQGYTVHLEVGIISHGASAKHSSSLFCPLLLPPSLCFPSVPPFLSRPPMSRSARSTIHPSRELKTICHRQRKYAPEAKRAFDLPLLARNRRIILAV